jgi:hypothetical protein
VRAATGQSVALRWTSAARGPVLEVREALVDQENGHRTVAHG